MQPDGRTEGSIRRLADIVQLVTILQVAHLKSFDFYWILNVCIDFPLIGLQAISMVLNSSPELKDWEHTPKILIAVAALTLFFQALDQKLNLKKRVQYHQDKQKVCLTLANDIHNCLTLNPENMSEHTSLIKRYEELTENQDFLMPPWIANATEDGMKTLNSGVNLELAISTARGRLAAGITVSTGVPLTTGVAGVTGSPV